MTWNQSKTGATNNDCDFKHRSGQAKIAHTIHIRQVMESEGESARSVLPCVSPFTQAQRTSEVFCCFCQFHILAPTYERTTVQNASNGQCDNSPQPHKLGVMPCSFWKARCKSSRTHGDCEREIAERAQDTVESKFCNVPQAIFMFGNSLLIQTGDQWEIAEQSVKHSNVAPITWLDENSCQYVSPHVYPQFLHRRCFC